MYEVLCSHRIIVTNFYSFIFLVLLLLVGLFCFFVFNQKTPYDLRISDWSSAVCSSDLLRHEFAAAYLTKRSILLGRGAAGECARCLGEAFRPVANLRRNRPCLDFCR